MRRVPTDWIYMEAAVMANIKAIFLKQNPRKQYVINYVSCKQILG